MTDTIKIISDPRYNALSNFQPCTIKDSKTGILLRSSEAYYMWHKCDDPEFKKLIQNCYRPQDAKYFGSKRGMKTKGFELVEGWDDGTPPRKVKVMHKVVKAKMTQNPVIAEILMSTLGVTIIEDAPWDAFWGTGRDGKGLNWLGRVLLRVRRELDEGTISMYPNPV